MDLEHSDGKLRWNGFDHDETRYGLGSITAEAGMGWGEMKMKSKMELVKI